MLLFLDESGDTGKKLTTGSSAYFTVGLVLFLDNDEALACDRRIDQLRTELKLPAGYEFHFANNSKRVREAFLAAIALYNFSVIIVAIDKQGAKLFSDGLDAETSFYQYATQLALTTALPYLNQATLVIDKSGSRTFQGELRRYLRTKLDDPEGQRIKRFKAQPSHHNNLLQVVDYCVGISSRKIQGKKDWRTYFQFINTKLISWQEWPK